MKGPDRIIGALEKALDSKYQVLRWIGGGGMAQVYLARHRMTGGMFAVKVLSEYLAQDEAIVERFIQEARTAAALSGHPNIVPIFDVGEQDDLHYLIMQYVDGEDLKTYLSRKGKLTPAEAARIVEQIADALSFAHARRVIHRDLKPSNIRMDRSGRAMVLDFGIAKAGEAPTLLTATGQRVGTPQYMAPERFMGTECDQRSDLYSLGVVFYELVAGVRPFDADTISAIEVAHMSKAPLPPRTHCPDLPEMYDRMIRKLLEKEPANRYPNAQALLADLQAAAAPAAPAVQTAGVPGSVQQTAPMLADIPAPAPRRPRLAWIALALFAIVALAGGAAIYFLRPSGSGSHPTATRSQPGAFPPRITSTTGDMVLVNGPAPFYVDVTEVANTTYKAFCDATGYPYPEAPAWEAGYFFKHPSHPVVNVTHEDAAAFAKWAGKRLPAEAEWEAAAGGNGKPYPWGDQPPAAHLCRSSVGTPQEDTAPAGALAAGASPSGALDMAGNAAEWTTTSYAPTPEDSAMVLKTAKLQPNTGWFAVKGGSFQDTTPGQLSISARKGWPAGVRSGTLAIGFRCVRDAAKERPNE